MESKMTSADIKEWGEHILKTLTAHFDECEQMPPIIHALCADGKPLLLPIDHLMNSDANKDIIQEAFMIFAKRYHIVACILVSEAWMVMREEKVGAKVNYNNYDRPSEAADKVEVMVANLETSLGVQQNIFLIKRDKLKPYLERWKEGESFSSMGGRFTNFLEKPYGTN